MSVNAKKTTKSNPRLVSLDRNTKETQISLEINLDGEGTADISTPIPFFSHMLHLLSRHGQFNLKAKATGDLPHHLVEDFAIVLGQAIDTALGDKKGIERYGEATIPMDETLAQCVVDLSGRPYFVGDLPLEGQHVEDMHHEDLIHFFETLAIHGKMNLHLRIFYGHNNHHKIEACFKALAHALRKAVKVTSDSLLSTKGTL